VYRRDGLEVDAPVTYDGVGHVTAGLARQEGTVSTELKGGVRNTSTQVLPGTVAKLRYDAFGNIVGGSGTWAGNEAHGGGFGYQTDPTGLQLLGHRWYDPLTGRFISKDPIGSGDNWYAYCDNNPLNSADPRGLQARELSVQWITSHLSSPCSSYGRIPKAPPGYNLREAMRDAKLYARGKGYHEKLAYFFEHVRPGGPYDFKARTKPKGGKDMVFQELVDYGNFNYGVIGWELGFQPKMLFEAGGLAAGASIERGFKGYGPYFKPPFYGDQPRDSFFVHMGIQWAMNRKGEKSRFK